MGAWHVDPNVSDAYKDFRGMPVDPESLADQRLSAIATEGDKMRLLTYEQVNLMRDLWVLAAIQDGVCDTHDLAIWLLTDACPAYGKLRSQDLFTCAPYDRDALTEEERERAFGTVEPGDAEAVLIAGTLASSLIRLQRQQHIVMAGFELA